MQVSKQRIVRKNNTFFLVVCLYYLFLFITSYQI